MSTMWPAEPHYPAPRAACGSDAHGSWHICGTGPVHMPDPAHATQSPSARRTMQYAYCSPSGASAACITGLRLAGVDATHGIVWHKATTVCSMAAALTRLHCTGHLLQLLWDLCYMQCGSQTGGSNCWIRYAGEEEVHGPSQAHTPDPWGQMSLRPLALVYGCLKGLPTMNRAHGGAPNPPGY